MREKEDGPYPGASATGVPVFTVRVYYEDTDAGGVVYYANYLKFAERARTEALRRAGIDQARMWSEHGTGFVVRRCIVDFLKPARLDDCLTIGSRLNDISGVSIDLRQTIQRGGTLLVTFDVRLAVVGADLKPRRVPPFVKEALLAAFCETD